jgi:aldose 1-epimerase
VAELSRPQPGVETALFGRMPNGTSVHLFTLTNANGLVARITDYGTVITELHTPDRLGRLGDIVLGFDNLSQYLEDQFYFGCTIGRVAGRIAHGRFTLDGALHTLVQNGGAHHLHGGIKGYHKVVWRAEPLSPPVAGVKFTHVSPDGDEGYPGRLDLGVVMTLTDGDALTIDYTATTDRTTPVNLTNHSYFNLAGDGDILGHELMLASKSYTPVDGTLIPTGEIRPVSGTPFDFTQATPIGARFDRLVGEPRGYDHNFVITRAGDRLAAAARVYEPRTGRTMTVATTQPGLQLYTGNYLDGTTGKRGLVHSPHSGFTLETQHFPDSVNQPAFPSTILRPGETYRHTTVYRFGTR